MSGLDDFLGGAVPVPTSEGRAEQAQTAAPPAPRKAVAPQSVVPQAPLGEDEKKPYGVKNYILPSGIQVYYQEGPKRLYRLLDPESEKEKFHTWCEVPSMSTVSKILDKPGLVSWAEKSGFASLQQMVQEEWVDLDFIKKVTPTDDPRKPWWTAAHLLEIAKTKKITTTYRKDEASDRGNNVHKALEVWAMSGTLPNPDDYPELERGYVVGLLKFLQEATPIAHKSEVVVASTIHEVAGRFDLLGALPNDVELVYHLTPTGKRGDKRKVFKADSYIIDLKTSAGVYEEHHLQTVGYKGILPESGLQEPNRGAVLRVTQDGRYEFVDLSAEWVDFWFLRGLYDSLEGIKARGHQNARKERP